jgi:hypothetical protein
MPNDIFGRNLGLIKGETTCRQLKGILSNIANLPKEIMLRYCDITLYIDIMYLNTIPLFMSISRNVKFITCTALNNRKEKTLMNTITEINSIYQKRGICITLILSDGGFECCHREIS